MFLSIRGGSRNENIAVGRNIRHFYEWSETVSDARRWLCLPAVRLPDVSNSRTLDRGTRGDGRGTLRPGGHGHPCAGYQVQLGKDRYGYEGSNRPDRSTHRPNLLRHREVAHSLLPRIRPVSARVAIQGNGAPGIHGPGHLWRLGASSDPDSAQRERNRISVTGAD